MRFTPTLALAATLGLTCAQDVYLGFNSGATTDDGTAKRQADFEKEFTTAQKLRNAPGVFNSARLYTNIQSYTEDDPKPIEAFPAAIKTKTKLLLGIWCSGTTSIKKELDALEAAIEEYGKDFTDLVVGLSVGSEDLYRVSEQGIQNESDVGQEADVIIQFIKDARKRLQGTALSKIPIGHVDTWTAWTNGTNKGVIDESDFVGTNLFPYYEKEKENDISKALERFNDAIEATEAAAGGKDVWITETGWPVSGPSSGDAKPSLENAKKYWQTVGCSLFKKTNTWWYVLQDSNPANEAKFGVTKDFSTTAQYNLTCPAVSESSSTVASSSATGTPTGSPTGSAAPAATTGAGSGSGENTETNPGNNGNNNGTSEENNDPEESTGGAMSMTSVSLNNALVVGLSMVFAVAAWAA